MPRQGDVTGASLYVENTAHYAGQNLQVYAALANGGFDTGGLTNLNITTTVSAPQATSTATRRQGAVSVTP